MWKEAKSRNDDKSSSGTDVENVTTSLAPSGRNEKPDENLAIRLGL
jgi:hypothetical protein